MTCSRGYGTGPLIRFGWLGLLAIALTFFVSPTFAGLPDLQNKTAPNPVPAAPGGWDIFTPPVCQALPPSGVPTVAEWTRIGAPDDTLILTGDLFSNFSLTDQGKDTQFLLYGQTNSTNGVQGVGSIQRLDGLKAAVTLPTGLPPCSTYLLWPQNSSGYGYPVAVNQTEAWWIGPGQATRGDTVSVYGRNLSHGGGSSTSWIYIKPVGAAGQWATVTSANSYQVQFTVPASLGDGAYEVWVHNGHGGSYGWSGPLSLTVVEPVVWTGGSGSLFNVQTYRQAGDPDDSNSIDRASAAASAYCYSAGGPYPVTLYFPGGAPYSLSRGIGMQAHFLYLGDGKTQTILQCNSNFNALALFVGQGAGTELDSEIMGMTLDANGNMQTFDTPGYGNLVMFNWSPTPSYDLRLVNVTFQTLIPNTGCAAISNVTRLSVTGCDFIGGGLFMDGVNDAAIGGCRFLMSSNVGTAINVLATNNLSITGCTAQDYDASSPAQGRFFISRNGFGTETNVYVGDNTTVNLGPPQGDNSGEQVLFEGDSSTQYAGSPTAATSTTVTLSGLSSSTDYTTLTAIINEGKGLGQHRKILGYDSSSGTITVSPAWNVVPDSTSTVLLETTANRWTVYHNTFQGKSYYATTYTAMTAIEPYGACFDWIGDSNTISQMRTALYIAELQETSPITSVNPCYFNYYANNQIQLCYEGMRASCGIVAGSQDLGVGFIGTVFRNNTLTDITTVGAYEVTDTPAAPGVPLDMTVFEHNTFTNLPGGFDFDQTRHGSRVEDAVLYKNSFNLGTAALSGSFGINFAATTLNPTLRQNTWLNFETTDTGTLPGALLSVPVRTFEMQGNPSGGAQTAVMAIWNDGTAPLGWTASSDSPWLTLSSPTGSVPDQLSSSALTISCDPGSLPIGTYVGTVSVVSGGQTMAVLVTFTVTPGEEVPVLPFWALALLGASLILAAADALSPRRSLDP